MLLRTKLILIFSLMTLLLVLVGACGFLFSWMTRQQAEQMTDHGIPAMRALVEAKGHLWSAMFAEEEEEADASFQELEASILTYGGYSILPEKTSRRTEMMRLALELQEGYEASPAGRSEGIFAALVEVLDRTLGAEADLLESHRGRRRGWFQLLTRLNAGLILLALLLCVFPGWRLGSRIRRSLLEAQEAANRVSSGDLNQQLAERGHDELGVLAKSFNHMIETIRQADREISIEVDERIRAEQKAQEAARAKSDFLAHMSHEFRTPLNGILGYSQVLLMDKGLSEKNRKVVDSLRNSGQSLLELINDVLDLSKIEAQRLDIHRSRFYLRDFLESIEETYAEQIQRKGLGFSLSLHEELPEDILSDPIRLRQVLVNLIGNAIKYTDNGSIRVEVKPLSMGVRFKIRDTGVGIREEDLETIFQPFVQVGESARSMQGTGLGLSITHRLLGMMGSRLKVESAPGEGSTFWFDLPQPEAGQHKIVMSPHKITGYLGERKRIFLLETHAEVGTLLTPLLRRVGFLVHVYSRADVLFDDMGELRPDAVLMDMYLDGESDGVETMRTLFKICERAGTPPPQVVLFSDHRETSDRERALKAGAANFMSKPIRFTDVLQMLEGQLHLTWINESSRDDEQSTADVPPPEEWVLPPLEEVRKLDEIARTGNVRKLREAVEALEATPEWKPFCEPLLTFCAGYRLNAVRENLKDAILELERRQHI